MDSPEARTESNQGRGMPAVREHEESPTASPGPQQATGGGDLVPEVPHESGHGARQMGARAQGSGRLDDLRCLGNSVVPLQAARALVDLLRRMT
jgi:hypothetical protein